jgi:hypothetical protein
MVYNDENLYVLNPLRCSNDSAKGKKCARKIPQETWMDSDAMIYADANFKC